MLSRCHLPRDEWRDLAGVFYYSKFCQRFFRQMALQSLPYLRPKESYESLDLACIDTFSAPKCMIFVKFFLWRT
jgi:hypothetical protein